MLSSPCFLQLQPMDTEKQAPHQTPKKLEQRDNTLHSAVSMFCLGWVHHTHTALFFWGFLVAFNTSFATSMAMEEKATAARIKTIIDAGPMRSVLFSKVTAYCHNKLEQGSENAATPLFCYTLLSSGIQMILIRYYAL